MRKMPDLFGAIAYFIVAMALTGLYGCNTLTIPSPDEIIKKPLGTESVKIGMTKSQVESIWGKPDSVTTAESKDKWSTQREVWTYDAHYGAIPVDAGYLSNSKKLYFDGENLTDIVG